MSSFWLTDMQKFGVVFCGAGGVSLMMGVIFFFDRSLLAFGNILFLLGLPLIIGPQKTLLFFARKQKLKGTAAFAAGILLILFKWAFIGFIVEAYGIAVLFGDFLFAIAGYVQGVPIIGPIVTKLVQAIGARRSNSDLPV